MVMVFLIDVIGMLNFVDIGDDYCKIGIGDVFSWGYVVECLVMLLCVGFCG